MQKITLFISLLLLPLMAVNGAMNWEDLSPQYKQHLQDKFCDGPDDYAHVIPVSNPSDADSNGAATTHHDGGGGSGNKGINKKAVAVGIVLMVSLIIFSKSKKKKKEEEKKTSR